MACAVKIGFFLLRTCNAPGNHICELCNRTICDRHIRIRQEGGMERARCVECLRSSSSMSSIDAFPYDDGPWLSSSGSSASPGDSTFTGHGGASGGGGASASWAPGSSGSSAAGSGISTPGSSSVVPEAGTLTPQDYALFDQVNAADQDPARADSYDS